MRERHEMLTKAYPNQANGSGIPYTGLTNARPETLEIEKRLKREKAAMPEKMRQYMH